MKKYIVLALFIFWGCTGNNSTDNDLTEKNPMSFSVLLSIFQKENAPKFDSNVLAYAQISPFEEDSAGWSAIAFNDIVNYFPKTASLLLKHRKCNFFILKQKKDRRNSFDVLESVGPEGSLIYHIMPTDSKGKSCNAVNTQDYWAFLVEDCSGKWKEPFPISYETYESSSWKCDDVLPYATQSEWVSTDLL